MTVECSEKTRRKPSFPEARWTRGALERARRSDICGMTKDPSTCGVNNFSLIWAPTGDDLEGGGLVGRFAAAPPFISCVVSVFKRMVGMMFSFVWRALHDRHDACPRSSGGFR
jgi:hypothetical protein